MANNENIKKAINYIQEQKESFNQGHPNKCIIGMTLRAAGHSPSTMGIHDMMETAATFLGVERKVINDLYAGVYPADLQEDMRLARSRSSFNYAAQAEVAIKTLERLLTPEPIVATAPAFSEEAGILSALLYSGKLKHSDVEAARTLVRSIRA